MSYNIEKHTALVKSSVIDIIASNCTKFKKLLVLLLLYNMYVVCYYITF